MKIHHTPFHWVLVALVMLALLIVSEAHGQSGGAAAVFEGRPAMAGAQGGQGALAGMPQGGIGVQGNEAAERGLRLNKPSALDDMRQAKRAGDDAVAAGDADLSVRKDIAPQRDRGIAKEERSAGSKTKRAVKRTISRAKHGTSPIDGIANAGPQ
ncbi:MAG: hypothetical protein ABIR26_11145 [Ramlibacter sp.]